MHDDTYQFLSLLLAHMPQQPGYLTFTAIHPDRSDAPPSRHYPLPCSTPDDLQSPVAALMHANALGWGAFVGIGLRSHDLGRWHRGTREDITALPALYADIDQPLDVVLRRVDQFPLPPTLVVNSGYGSHLYWLLQSAVTNMRAADAALQALAHFFDGDPLTSAQSLRLVGSRNTKRERHNARCTIVQNLPDAVYPFALFPRPEPPATAPPPPLPRSTGYAHSTLNPQLIRAVLETLYRDYQAAPKSAHSRWHKALCPFGHARDHVGSHFWFDELAGAGNCFGRHGPQPLKSLCEILQLRPDDFGGLYV